MFEARFFYVLAVSFAKRRKQGAEDKIMANECKMIEISI